MSKSNWISHLKNTLPIAAGTAVYAFGLHYFIIPNELMEGGLTGVAVLLKYLLDIPTSVTTLVANIPLFLIGWRVLGAASMMYTILGTLLLSGWLWVMEVAVVTGSLEPFKTDDVLLATLYAGVTIGAGLGLVFRFGGTTGGADILARVLHKWRRGWSIGQIILCVDVLVIGSSLLFLPREKVLYTLVAVFIASRVIDFVTEGAYQAKAFLVVTTRPDAIAERITKELDRSATMIPARGAYSRDDKQIVYCVVNRHEVRQLKTIVKSADPHAFLIISDVHDVIGEGFKPY